MPQTAVSTQYITRVQVPLSFVCYLTCSLTPGSPPSFHHSSVAELIGPLILLLLFLYNRTLWCRDIVVSAVFLTCEIWILMTQLFGFWCLAFTLFLGSSCPLLFFYSLFHLLAMLVNFVCSFRYHWFFFELFIWIFYLCFIRIIVFYLFGIFWIHQVFTLVSCWSSTRITMHWRSYNCH